jgi:hypothetical protein
MNAGPLAQAATRPACIDGTQRESVVPSPAIRPALFPRDAVQRVVGFRVQQPFTASVRDARGSQLVHIQRPQPVDPQPNSQPIVRNLRRSDHQFTSIDLVAAISRLIEIRVAGQPISIDVACRRRVDRAGKGQLETVAASTHFEDLQRHDAVPNDPL